MAQTVVGLFHDHQAAQHVVEQLLSAGFSNDQIQLSKRTPTENQSNKEEGDSSIARFFKSLFGDNEEAERYSQAGNNSSIITVQAQSRDEAQHATQLLNDYGAVNVKEREEGTPYPGNADRDNERERNYEDYKPRVSADVQSPDYAQNPINAVNQRDAVDQPVENNLQPREENKREERNPMDGAFGEINLQSFQEGTIELIERKEISVVNKEARVVEEIRLQKENTEREEIIHENLRETKVDIDKVKEREFKSKDTFDQGTELDYDIKREYRVEKKNAQRTNDDTKKTGSNDDLDWNNDKRGRNSDPLFGA